MNRPVKIAHEIHLLQKPDNGLVDGGFLGRGRFSPKRDGPGNIEGSPAHAEPLSTQVINVKLFYSVSILCDNLYVKLLRFGGIGLAVRHVHTYLVHIGKGKAEPPKIGGALVALKGKLFDLLNAIYAKSDDECDIDITFSLTSDGKQQNPFRDMMLEYLREPTLSSGRVIAERLEGMTDNRSGLGLLFLISGSEGKERKLVISRFPTDSAILADENQTALTVEFLERVFMKSKYSYKAVSYRGQSLKGDFWSGRAIDKQSNASGAELSNYWIAEFLASEFSITPAAGTRRLAVALREAARKADIEVKTELAAATTLASRLRGQRLSIDEFEERFGLSPEARTALRGELKNSKVAQERFQFDQEEFNSVIRYRSVELSNGGIMVAPAGDFDNVFKKEVVNKEKKRVRYSTEGTVVDTRLKKGL